MLIQQKQVGHTGKFYVEENGEELAEMAYKMPSPDKMIIVHTEVSDALRGKNVGKQLVMHAVEYARANDIKIIPHCTYAKSVFDRTPAIQDVLFKPE